MQAGNKLVHQRASVRCDELRCVKLPEVYSPAGGSAIGPPNAPKSVKDESEEALEEAIASSDLVVVEHPRAAYWRGQPISVDWGRRSAPWNFLWVICEHAKAGKAVDHTTFNAADAAIVAKQKSRLRGLKGFPRALAALIQPAGRYTQKLNLPPPQIRLFEMTLGERVRERIP